MIATLEKDGKLVVRAETGLDSYALRHWSEENLRLLEALKEHFELIIDLKPVDSPAPSDDDAA